MKRVTLQGPVDISGFRREARALVGAGVPPDQVRWSTDSAPADLFGDPEADDDSVVPAAPEGVRDLFDAVVPAVSSGAAATDQRSARFSVPASFLNLCTSVLLHSEPQRFDLMYRLLWRLRSSPDSWQDRLDPERRRADQMAREVRRAIHKMHAFVRFFPVADADGERYLAWFEPDHFVEEAAAPFFARRFANMRWAILTPRCSLSWDGQAIHTGPAGRREDVPPMDAGAELWLTYYRSIFNPARLKVSMMEKEMPRRYWANLPEAALIEPLIAQAQGRTEDMLASGATVPRKIRPMKRPGPATPDR